MYIAIIILLTLGIALFYASYSIRLGVYIKCLCKNKKSGKVVALTFDDGIDPHNTPRILAILKERGVKATFFIIGRNAEKYPLIVKEIAEQGHEIGNHSYIHTPKFTLMSGKEVFEDIKKCDDIIEKITNKRPIYFRPPYGVTNPMVAKGIKMAGHITIGWSIRSLDTLNKSREWVLKRVIRRLHNGAVILLHDNRENGDTLLIKLLNHLTDKGYKTATITELFKDKVK